MMVTWMALFMLTVLLAYVMVSEASPNVCVATEAEAPENIEPRIEPSAKGKHVVKFDGPPPPMYGRGGHFAPPPAARGRLGYIFMPGRGFFGSDSYGGDVDEGERYPRHGMHKMTKLGITRYKVDKDEANEGTKREKTVEHGTFWYIITWPFRKLAYWIWAIS